MPRQKRTFKDPEKRKAHEARLKKRREAHARARGHQLGKEAAEAAGINFEELLERERKLMEGTENTDKLSRKGAAIRAGSTSPKVMSTAREHLAYAFDLLGGVPALVVWGRQNPTEFYRIWAKLIPTNVKEASTAMPLETLLEKLASREEMSVGHAAMDIGQELLEAGRREASREDALGLGPSDEDTLQ